MTHHTHSGFDWLIGMLLARRPLRVLDLGCADCPEGEVLVAAGAELVGVELDEAAIMAARGRLPGASFACGERAAKAFQEDLELCAAYGASGFPTMRFRPTADDSRDTGGRGILVGGHRSLATYEQVLAKVAPGLERYQPRQVEALLAEYGPLTTRELSEILGKVTEQDLRERATQGKISAVELRGGTMWALPGDTTVGRAKFNVLPRDELAETVVPLRPELDDEVVQAGPLDLGDLELDDPIG